MRLGIAALLLLLSVISANAFYPGNDPPFRHRPATSTAQSPGPSSTLYASPLYTCSTNYYVSASAGGSGNGTSGSPWTLAQAMASSTPTGGSCINMSAGTYNLSSAIAFTHGGTSSSATGYLVYRCTTMPFSFSSGALQGEGSGCVIKSNAAMAHMTQVTAGAYLWFDGIEFSGNNFQAYGACIDIEVGGGGGDGTAVHHIILTNSDVHHCGQSGLQWNNSEWFWVIHSVVHDNAACSVNFLSPCASTEGVYGSGISFFEPIGLNPSGGYTPTTFDNQYCATVPASICFHDVIAYNVLYHNYNGQTGTTNSDGEGIILDDLSHQQAACPTQGTGHGICRYTGAFLVMGNASYNNGGRGIEVFDSAYGVSDTSQKYIVNNSLYANGWDCCGAGGGQDLSVFQTYNPTEYNNIAYGTNGYAYDFTTTFGTVTTQNNMAPAGGVSQDASQYPTTGANANNIGSSVSWANASTSSPNFSLNSGSAARGFGRAFDLWQQTGTVDAGACPSSLTSCP